MALDLSTESIEGRWEPEPPGQPCYQILDRGGRTYFRGPIRFEGDLRRGDDVGGVREGKWIIFTTIRAEMKPGFLMGTLAADDVSLNEHKGSGVRRAHGWIDMGRSPYAIPWK